MSECAHCGKRNLTRGGWVPKPGGGYLRLCHTNELASDCYRLVTVYQHEMPCDRCGAVKP